MTDNPRTLQFDVTEWRDLCIHAAQRIAKDLERFDQPTDVEVADAGHKLDRLKVFLTGWSRSGIVAPVTTEADRERWRYLADATAPRPLTAEEEKLTEEAVVQAFEAAAKKGVSLTKRRDALSAHSMPVNGPPPRKRGRPRKVVQPDATQ